MFSTSKKTIYLSLLYIVIVNAVLLLGVSQYQYFTVYTAEYILSFTVFGLFVINYIRDGVFLSLEVMFNLFGILYTNFYIGQLILANCRIEETTYFVMLLSHFSMFVFNIAFILAKETRVKMVANCLQFNAQSYNYSKVYGYTFVLFCVSMLAEVYVLFFKIGILNYFTASRATKSLMSSDYSILSFYKFTFPVVAFIFLYLFMKCKRKSSLVWFGIACGASLFNSLIARSRTEMLAVVLPIICLLYFYGYINNTKVVIAGITGIIFFGAWKALLMDGDFSISFDSEFNTWYEVCKNVLEDPTFEFRYGRTYLDTLLNLIVPVTNTEALSEWYMKTYEAYIYSLGGGRGFSSVLEAYINGGILGNVLVYAFYGWLFKQLKRDSSFQMVFYLIMMTSMHQFFRSESYSLWKNMMWFKVYPVFLIFFLSSRAKSHSKFEDM